jgi:hypothetical protein
MTKLDFQMVKNEATVQLKCKTTASASDKFRYCPQASSRMDKISMCSLAFCSVNRDFVPSTRRPFDAPTSDPLVAYVCGTLHFTS